MDVMDRSQADAIFARYLREEVIHPTGLPREAIVIFVRGELVQWDEKGEVKTLKRI